MKAKLIVPLVLLVLLLTGCYSFDRDSLYALPLRSEEYRALQSAVESALGSGSYSAPVSGDNPQPVQQMDLDGDGQEEVLVFCKMDGERPLRVLIFRLEEERFTLACTLDGDEKQTSAAISTPAGDESKGMYVRVTCTSEPARRMCCTCTAS